MHSLILFILLISILCYSIRKRTVYTTNNKLEFVRQKLIAVDPRAKNISFFVNDTESYTLNKNEVHMCVSKPSGEYYSDDMLMYIGLHELAHALIPHDTSTHPPEYDKLFKQLKDRAQYMNLFNPVIKFPEEYCGKKLTHY